MNFEEYFESLEKYDKLTSLSQIIERKSKYQHYDAVVLIYRKELLSDGTLPFDNIGINNFVTNVLGLGSGVVIQNKRAASPDLGEEIISGYFYDNYYRNEISKTRTFDADPSPCMGTMPMGNGIILKVENLISSIERLFVEHHRNKLYAISFDCDGVRTLWVYPENISEFITYDVIDFNSVVGIEYLLGEIKITLAAYDKSGYTLKELHKVDHDIIFSCISNMLKRHGYDHDVINILMADSSNEHEIISLVYNGSDFVRSVKFGVIFEKNDGNDECTAKIELYGNKSTVYIKCSVCMNNNVFDIEDSFILKHNTYGYMLDPVTSM